ncbi:MAG: hypothetical protein IT486_05830 [Gammaproteobacteria bacterium]|nr:hypothetical protein [Gammaproteobacteria bacterium]
MTTSAYLDSQNRLHRETVSGECPHCGNSAHFSLLACPGFARLRTDRPARVGIVVQCDSCRTPLFLRYRVRAWLEDRVEFHPHPEEMERAPERFAYDTLPERVAATFREALACHGAGLLQAFAVMCRATTQAMLEDLGERSRLRIFDQVAEVKMLAEIDDGTFAAVRRVLFEGEPPRGTSPAPLTRLQAAVLLETMKDLLFQTYVRRARLQAALRLRQFPPAESAPRPAGDLPASRSAGG